MKHETGTEGRGTMTYYSNLIGVFAKQFPLVTGRVAGRNTRESVTYHGQLYHVIGDPRESGTYAFDVATDEPVTR